MPESAPAGHLRSGIALAFFCFFQLARKLFHTLAHHLAGLELDRRPRRYHETATRLIWVTAHARFGQARLKNAEITQFYRHIAGQAVGDLIERPLDSVENLMLYHSSLVTDRYHNVAFSQFCHGSYSINRSSLVLRWPNKG